MTRPPRQSARAGNSSQYSGSGGFRGLIQVKFKKKRPIKGRFVHF